MQKNKKSLLVMTALIRIIIAVVVLFVIVIPGCDFIRAAFFSPEKWELSKLGEPDANGIYRYEASASMPIWYTYNGTWWWTHYDPYNPPKDVSNIWMSVTTTTVSGGRLDGLEPVKENIDIINYLAANNPEPP